MLSVRKKVPAQANDEEVLSANELEGEPRIPADDRDEQGERGLFLQDEPRVEKPKPAKRRWFARKRPAEMTAAGEMIVDDATPADESSSLAKAKSRRFWPQRKRAATAQDVDRSAPRLVELPIRVLMGYLPAVSARDAAEFALGVAEKNFDQPAISFFDAFPHEEGYVYEVHEGGAGRAFAPNVLKHLMAASFTDDNPAVVLATATRAVRVELTRGGLQCVLLPESADVEPTEGIVASVKMRPVITKRTGLLVSGAGIFVTGFFGLLFALLARVPSYEAPPIQKVERVTYEQLPMANWARVSSVPPHRYVKALRFEKGAWRIEDAPINGPDATPAPPPGAPIDATSTAEAQP
jgi:hypothetical protein